MNVEGDSASATAQGSPQASQRRSPARVRPAGPPKKSVVTRLWDFLQPLARLWGLITAIVMSGAGAELVVLGHHIAPVLLAGAAFVFLLETMWVVALFVDLLCRRGEYTLSLRCWDFMRWSCGRARAPFYACAATAILIANLTILSTIAGSMLIVQAALRAAVPFSPYATHGPHSPRAGSSLLSQYDSPLPDVFYNAGQTDEERCEEMTVLEPKPQDRQRSVTPRPPLLEL